jgi:outer membrane protein OmpA-like peptidoglycan-associated protein
MAAWAVAAAVGASAVAASAVGAATRQEDGEPRVRDLEYRVRDLEYRWRALDNSERVQVEAEQTTVIFAADVLVEFDRADLTATAQSRLSELVAQLRDLGPRAVTVAGHTDAIGDTAYNQDLSQRRAASVEACLAQRLGRGFRFDAAGYGESRPVAANQNQDGSDNPQGRALNRRVEITFPTG